MERLFRRLRWGVVPILFCLGLCGCLRIDKVVIDAEVKPPPQEFAVGRTTLADVLASYGAPAEILDMKGHFSIHYQRAFYRGAYFAVSIPLTNTFQASFNANGNLQRYDMAVFVFTPEGILSDMTYAKGTNHPLWSTYWK